MPYQGEVGRWYHADHPKIQRTQYPTRSQKRRQQRVRQLARMTEKGYKEEEPRSKDLLALSRADVPESSKTQPNRSENTSGNLTLMAVAHDESEDWLNSFDYEDEGTIQFRTIPNVFTTDMVFVLPMSFMARPNQPMTMNGDVTDPEAESAMIEQIAEYSV